VVDLAALLPLIYNLPLIRPAATFSLREKEYTFCPFSLREKVPHRGG